MWRELIFIVLVLLAVLLACSLAYSGDTVRVAAAVFGGATAPPPGGDGPAISSVPPRGLPEHDFGAALNEYAFGLGARDIVGMHPLDQCRYTPPPPPPAREGGAKARPKAWTDHTSWESLRGDKVAYAAYFAQRSKLLDNPALDWGPVLEELRPHLSENREYIGVANLDPDGVTMRLVGAEASPTAAGEDCPETTFAGVPARLVKKYAGRPGLVILHTHPSDPRCGPLPSSHDLSTAIYLGATARFAANAVVSRYGVLMYGLSWEGYKSINESKDWELAALNFSHDVVAAHEAIRSWSTYNIADHLAFYPRHRLFAFSYPSAEMVGDLHRLKFREKLESPIDYDLIADHQRRIDHYLKAKKTAPAGDVVSNSAQGSRRPFGLLETDLGFD